MATSDRGAGDKGSRDQIADGQTQHSEKAAMTEVHNVPPKERMDILAHSGGAGQDVPSYFKSSDGTDATVGPKVTPGADSERKPDQTITTTFDKPGPVPFGTDSMEAVTTTVSGQEASKATHDAQADARAQLETRHQADVALEKEREKHKRGA